MIPITIYLVYLLVILFCAGCVAQHVLRGLGTIAASGADLSEPETEVSQTLLLGLVLVTVIASAVSLFHAVDLTVHLAVSASLLALGGRDLLRFLRNCSFEQMGMRTWMLRLLGLGCLGVVVFAASDKVAHYDTGLYHAQVVKWTNEFGVVPGLANLHHRLGFNSAWHVFASFVDQAYFNGRSSHIVGLVICVIFLLVCFQGFQRWVDGDRSIGTLLRALGILVVIVNFRTVLASLSTDWPTVVLLYYTVILTVERVERQLAGSIAPHREVGLATVTLVSVFAVTVKLSSVPILLLLLLWLSLFENKRGAAMLVLVSASLIIVPFVARNIMLTGYVVYPLAGVDLFSFDWKVPPAEVQSTTSLLKYWQINPVNDWYRAMDMDFGEQFRTWVKFRRGEILQVFPWFCIGALAWIGVTIQTRARPRIDFLLHSAICCIILAGMFFCLVKAPDPRFAMGWFLAFGLFPSAWLCHVATSSLNVPGRTWRVAGYVVLVGCTLWMMRHAGVKRLWFERGECSWKLNDLPVAELKELQTEAGVIVRVPVNGNRVWNAALPTTTPSDFNPFLQMRGRTLKDGFRVTDMRKGSVAGETRRRE